MYKNMKICFWIIFAIHAQSSNPNQRFVSWIFYFNAFFWIDEQTDTLICLNFRMIDKNIHILSP